MIVASLIVAIPLILVLVVLALRNEARVKREAYDYATGRDRIDFDRKRIGA